MTDVAVVPTTLADPTDPSGTVSSVTLLCGYSGSGKSSQLATAAEYVWETFHKWSSYYLFDGGGIPTQVQALANKGIIRLWKVRTRSMEQGAPTTIYRAASGWWPKRINPRTGEVDPAVDLVPPMTQTIECRCANGHLKQTVRYQQNLTPGMCPTCQQPVNASTWKLSFSAAITKGFEQRGACLFDSIPGASTWMLEDLAQRGLGGEGTRLGGVVLSDGKQFGENNRGQVGFAQTSVRQWMGVSSAIPNLVIPPIWTALIKEATAAGSKEGETMGLRLRGPDIEAGTAKTATVPQWVGNCIEVCVAEHDGKKWRQLRLKSYVDGEGFFHPLKIRSYPGMLPDLLEDEDSNDPKQARFVNCSMSTFHKLNDQARITCETMFAEKYPDAPGLAGAGEFGDDEVAPAPEAKAPTAPGPRPAPAAVAPRPVGAPVKAVVSGTPPAPTVAAGSPPVTGAPSRPGLVPIATATPAVAPVSAAPSVASTGPVAPMPPPSRPPVRGPVAAPPGRRPTPVAPKPPAT